MQAFDSFGTMAKLVVLLTVVVVALAQQEYPPPVKWDRMSSWALVSNANHVKTLAVTWRPGNGSPNQDAFFNVPVNLNTQARSGFREVFEDSGCMASELGRNGLSTIDSALSLHCSFYHTQSSNVEERDYAFCSHLSTFASCFHGNESTQVSSICDDAILSI